MAEDMTFLPRKEVLSIEELSLVARAFVELGVSKVRLTGGEPLIRKNVEQLVANLSALEGINELCMTTNASNLAEKAEVLKEAGLDRINISLDSLQASRFSELTRFGKLQTVLEGIEAARKQEFQLKINAVVLKNFNFDEAASLAEYALSRNIDISFIEEMPLGEIHSHHRNVEYVSSNELRRELSQHFHLYPSQCSTGGPSRYWRAEGYSGKIGFISPHSENFCQSCNRVRVTASGRLLLCLGNEHSVDLRDVIRKNPNPLELLKQSIASAMHIKPEKHEFELEKPVQILRFMNTTGG
jgi:cyclic pyranopterin phosphate synthase